MEKKEIKETIGVFDIEGPIETLVSRLAKYKPDDKFIRYELDTRREPYGDGDRENILVGVRIETNEEFETRKETERILNKLKETQEKEFLKILKKKYEI